MLRFLNHLNLPKARFQIHSREELGPYHGLHGLLHTGKGEDILFGPVIQLTKVNAEPEPPVLLADQHHCVTPRGLAQVDCTPSTISWRCSRSSSTRGGAIHWNLSLKGSVSRSSIMCSAASVQPISFLSRENILRCSINIRSNFKANSGGHFFNLSSRPSFCSISNSNFCLSSTVSFLVGSRRGSNSFNFCRNSGEGVAS